MNSIAQNIQAANPVALINRADLSRAVSLAAMVVENRNTIPILRNLLLAGDHEYLTISGTDLDMEISVKVPCAAEGLNTTLPAATLKNILAKAKNSATATLKQLPETDDGAKVSIDLAGIRFTARTIPAVDYPIPHYQPRASWTDAEGKMQTAQVWSYELPAAGLARLLAKTRFAHSTEATRYYLNGAYLHEDKGTLRAVATDGHRLACFTMPWNLPEGLPGLILPTKTVDVLLKILGKSTDTVTIDCTITGIRFTLGKVSLVSKIVDETFPDYERVVPRHNDKFASIAVKSFSEAVAQVELISNQKQGHRAVKLALSDNQCNLRVASEGETAETSIACAYQAAPIEIGFNTRYLNDLMEEMESDSFDLNMADAGSPTLFKDPAEPNWFAVLMPIRV